MKLQNSTSWLIIERVLPGIVLGVLLFYTYAKFFGHPYGFRWDGSSGVILFVFDPQPEPTLHVGDRLIRIGDVTWEAFNQDLRKTFFDGVRPGETVSITVERDEQRMDIDWVYPSASPPDEFLDQLVSEWFLAYFFWLAGLVTVLAIRPKDERWLLMALFNFLTAIWLIAGSGVSVFQIWGSALVLRMAVFLCIPVYLHLHWLFPRPLRKVSPVLVSSLYVVALLLAVAQAFQLVPEDFFLFGFLVALGGSLILLVIHLVRQSAARRDLRLVFMALVLALTLAIVWQIAYSLKKTPAWLGSAGLLGLPLLPLTYLYSAFRRRLGGLEVRVNRFFSLYLFVILLGIIEVPLIIILEQIFRLAAEAATISLISSLSTAAAFIWGYPLFERFVEQRILGIPLPSKSLLEFFSTRISTSLSLPTLIRVLHEEVFPSLLIRQVAFLQYDQGSFTVLSSRGVNTEQIPGEVDLPDLLARSGFYRSPDLVSGDQPYSWIRLVLPLKLGDQVLGFWLFGRRDPDDLYPQQEIPTLISLANLAAIALSNIIQTVQLKAMYEANIDHYEQERLRLGRDLHDSILNEMAALPLRSDAPVFSPPFRESYERVSEQLREIVHDLRPPMLSFGLKLALESLAESLRERNPENAEITTEIETEGECRYPLVVENNLYRIVQEACENALRYSRARRISIFGSFLQKEFEINIRDDGKGLQPDISLKLNDLLAQKHFGLAGMHERAGLIGAEIRITSRPNEGTQIHVRWSSKESI